MREPIPENIPFSRTICNGSFDDIFRVQLFSNPQQMVASKTNKEPYEKRRLDISSKDSIPQDNVTKNIPNHNLVLIFSLNTIRAIIAVATISKLLSNDAFAAVVEFRPNSKQIGAAISKTIIAMVYGNSDFVNFNSFASYFFIFRIRAINIIPIPAPT